MKRFHKGWTGILVVALSLAAGGRSARADVVAPPEGGMCPPGTQPNPSHGLDIGSCNIEKCTTDSECMGGKVCRDLQLCSNGSWATQSCAGGVTCDGSFPCTTEKACVAEGSSSSSTSGSTSGQPPAGGEDTGCSCRLTSPHQGGLAMLAVGLGCALVTLSRRRSSGASRRAHVGSKSRP
jgi:hypothetical protein